jgi:hypothetical protein
MYVCIYIYIYMYIYVYVYIYIYIYIYEGGDGPCCGNLQTALWSCRLHRADECMQTYTYACAVVVCMSICDCFALGVYTCTYVCIRK